MFCLVPLLDVLDLLPTTPFLWVVGRGGRNYQQCQKLLLIILRSSDILSQVQQSIFKFKQEGESLPVQAYLTFRRKITSYSCDF